jgi:hypothetical protein
VRFWNALEEERPDIRFVYITHDLTFALSRRSATFVMATPPEQLNVVQIGGELPSDVAEVLLGAASFSFYAKRVVLCEGDEKSVDRGSWIITPGLDKTLPVGIGVISLCYALFAS